MQRITYAALVEKMARMPVEMEVAIVEALRKGAVQVHKTAVEKFGTYQPASGSFQGWAALTSATVDAKIRAGAQSDDPLIGHYAGKGNKIYPTSLRQSLAMEVDEKALAFQVGTNDPVGAWQEYGTGHIPPRPFLRPALYENEQWIKDMLKHTVGTALMEAAIK